MEYKYMPIWVAIFFAMFFAVSIYKWNQTATCKSLYVNSTKTVDEIVKLCSN